MANFIPQCKTRGCTRAVGVIGDQSVAYCSADCMVSRGSLTDSEGGPCRNTRCDNSKEPDGRGGYDDYCCSRCKEGRGLDRRPVEEEGGGAGMDEFAELFPTLG
ncbi:unnamed protein product [Ectocarpus sp. 12 AP-2014]